MKRMSLDGIYVQKKDILSIYSIYGIFPARLTDKIHDKFVNMSKDLRSDEFVREIKSLDYEIQGIKDVILEKERNLRFNIDDNEDLKR